LFYIIKQKTFIFIFFTWYCCSVFSCTFASQSIIEQQKNSASFNIKIHDLSYFLSQKSTQNIQNELENLGFQRTIKKRKNNLSNGVNETHIPDTLYSLSELITQYKDSHDDTIVHYACYASHAELLKSLKGLGVSMDPINHNNQTPVYYAKKTKIVDILLDQNELSLLHKDNNEQTPLAVHIQQNHIEIVKIILHKMSSSRNQSNNQGPHPLSFVQSIEMAKLLQKYHKSLPPLSTEMLAHTQGLKEQEQYFWAIINIMPNINIQNVFGEGLLHLAAKKNLHEVVKKLLDRNINIHAQTAPGLTALHIAAFFGHIEIVSTILDHAKKIEEQGSVNTQAMLIEQEDMDGSTALMVAVQANHTSIAEQLMAARANVHHCNKNKHSLLHFVKDPNLALTLILHGLSVDDKGILGHTPLHLTKNVSIAQLFIEHEADVNAQTLDGDTALHLTRRNDITKVLLKNGAHVNSQNSRKRTPLHYAVQYNNVAQCKQLLAKKADINALDADKQKPFAFLNSQNIPYGDFVFEELENFIEEENINSGTLVTCKIIGKPLKITKFESFE